MADIVLDVPAGMAGRRTFKGRRYPFEQLEVGDMFFVAQRQKNTLMALASKTGAKLERTFRTRLLWMHKVNEQWVECNHGDSDAVQGIAVFRTN